jgi:hypothetical protein
LVEKNEEPQKTNRKRRKNHMKKLIALVLAAAFVFGAANMASATEIKADGEFKMNFLYFDSAQGAAAFLDEDEVGGFTEDNSYMKGRVRYQLRMIANDYLQGVVRMEYGEFTWGGDEASLVEFNRAYIDFFWPGTEVNFQVGRLPFVYPDAGYFGNAWFDDTFDGIVMRAPMGDMATLVLLYSRLQDGGIGTAADPNAFPDDETDLVSAAVAMNFEGITLAPYAGVAFHGVNTPGDLTGGAQVDDVIYPWVIGLAASADFDPIAVYADFLYSSVSDEDADPDLDVSGYLIDAAIEYNGLDFLTPSIFGAYKSGLDEDDDAGELSTPILLSSGWSVPGSFIFDGGGMLDNPFDLDGEFNGFWTVGLNLDNISFIDKLSHQFVALYVQGTNDPDTVAGAGLGSALSDDDSLFEIDFNSKYKIYEELSAALELAAIVPDFDEDRLDDDNDDPAIKAAFALNYKF